MHLHGEGATHGREHGARPRSAPADDAAPGGEDLREPRREQPAQRSAHDDDAEVGPLCAPQVQQQRERDVALQAAADGGRGVTVSAACYLRAYARPSTCVCA